MSNNYFFQLFLHGQNVGGGSEFGENAIDAFEKGINSGVISYNHSPDPYAVIDVFATKGDGWTIKFEVIRS